MSMAVSFTGTAGNSQTTNKKNVSGAKIGAGVGFAYGAVRTFMKRDVINQLGDSLVLAGRSKAVANASKGIGIVIGIGVLMGIGALVGKGVEKAVNHFKKDKPKGVIPGGNPKEMPKVEGDPFSKYRVADKNVAKQ